MVSTEQQTVRAASVLCDARKADFERLWENPRSTHYCYLSRFTLSDADRLPYHYRIIMSETTRADGRAASQLRPLRFQNLIAPYAAGSTLIEWGNTQPFAA